MLLRTSRARIHGLVRLLERIRQYLINFSSYFTDKIRKWKVKFAIFDNLPQIKGSIKCMINRIQFFQSILEAYNFLLQIADTLETIKISVIDNDLSQNVPIPLVTEMLTRNVNTLAMAGTYSLNDIEILIQVRRVVGSGGCRLGPSFELSTPISPLIFARYFSLC